MEPELITDPVGIGKFEDEWRRLAELRGNAFVTPDWFRSCWENRPDSTSPLVSVVRRADGSVAGVMPLVLDAGTKPRAIRFAGAGLGDRFHPAAARKDQDAVAVATMEALERGGLGRHVMLMERIDPTASWWSAMQRASTRRLAAIEQQRSKLLYIPLKGLDWDGYLSQRSAKFRAQVRRRERVLVRDHALKVRSATDETLGADLDEMFRLHSLRWKGRSTLDAPDARRAVVAFATAAQRRGWLRLHFLEADGAPAAAFLDWRLGPSYASYQGGFDPAWSKKSVGTVLTAITIRTAIEEGAEEFDFLLGDEEYKRRFTTVARPGATVVLTPAMRPTRLLIAGEAGTRRYGRSLARRRGFRRVTQSLRALLPTHRRS